MGGWDAALAARHDARRASWRWRPRLGVESAGRARAAPPLRAAAERSRQGARRWPAWSRSNRPRSRARAAARAGGAPPRRAAACGGAARRPSRRALRRASASARPRSPGSRARYPSSGCTRSGTSLWMSSTVRPWIESESMSMPRSPASATASAGEDGTSSGSSAASPIMPRPTRLRPGQDEPGRAPSGASVSLTLRRQQRLTRKVRRRAPRRAALPPLRRRRQAARCGAAARRRRACARRSARRGSRGAARRHEDRAFGERERVARHGPAGDERAARRGPRPRRGRKCAPGGMREDVRPRQRTLSSIFSFGFCDRCGRADMQPEAVEAQAVEPAAKLQLGRTGD